jgi:anti-sigma regulatory factor (Ser/Thr protein kinase)
MVADVADKDIERIRLALTEACANVVRHAYPGDPGMLDVSVCVEPETVLVVVKDRGVGVGLADDRREPPESGPGGLGLPLIDMLADRVEVAPRHPGTSIRMTFRLH